VHVHGSVLLLLVLVLAVRRSPGVQLKRVVQSGRPVSGSVLKVNSRGLPHSQRIAC